MAVYPVYRVFHTSVCASTRGENSIRGLCHDELHEGQPPEAQPFDAVPKYPEAAARLA
jgi:hypothetical protein